MRTAGRLPPRRLPWKPKLLSVGIAALAGLISSGTSHVLAQERGERVLATKDQAGRVQSRSVISADGTRHVTMREYWPDSTVTRLMEDADLDRNGRPTKRIVQEFDDRGRLLERRQITLDGAGGALGTRTRYSYDPEGRRVETAAPIAP